MLQGQMDATAAKSLVNSISRFIHLVSFGSVKLTQMQKNYDHVAKLLKHLKPLIDEVIDYRIASDENLSKVCQEMDMAVNEAKDFAEHWSPKKSKIHSLVLSGQLLNRIRSYSLEICHVISKFLESSSSSGLSDVQNCMQEINCLKLEGLTVDIEESLRSQRENNGFCHEHVIKIIEPLGFTSNRELFKESIALEKERVKAELNKMKGELYVIEQILDLLSYIRNYRMRSECSEISNSISIPAYFRCPLSLELMLDPVIVASGQTYERTSIQEWLDQGLTICPKTRQKLTHANLIPNYTVKAMVANWREENCVTVSSESEQMNFDCVTSKLNQFPEQELFHTLSIKSSLSGSNSTPRSSFQAGNGFENQNGVFSRIRGLSNGCQNSTVEKFEQPSPAPSSTHSRSPSMSSSVSSTDYGTRASNEVLKTSTRCQKEFSGEITSESFCSNPPANDADDSPLMSGKQIQVPEREVNMSETRNNSYSKAHSLLLKTDSDALTSVAHVTKLIEDLNSQPNDVQTMAAEELRFLAKHNMENRIIIGQCGAIAPLLALLYSKVKLTQEHAVTAILNLSISDENKVLIVEAGAIDAFIHVLKTGSDAAKENSAAAIYSLSVLEKYKAKIGRSGVIKALVNLLSSGTLRGKKDAAAALFNLSIFHENKARMVQAGAVKYLVQLLDPSTGMVDKAVALLANLSSIGDGRLSIAREGGIPLLVEIVESGSLRGKENAASVLLQLCVSSPKHCTLVLQEGAVPPLVALSQSGTPRAREKAQQLLSHFRNQREGALGKGKSS